MSLKSNKGLVLYAHKALTEDWVYWYGTTGKLCTESLLASKKRQYPAHYTEDRMATYRRHIAEGRMCADCINLIKGYMWLDEVSGVQKYASNGCPDTNADGMFAKAKEKGDIATMPDIPGLIVRFSGHAGVYVGNGMVIEARGFKYGVVLTELKKRPWTHWYKLHCMPYDANLTENTNVSLLGTRTLRRGMKGEDVRRMQELLEADHIYLEQYGADGDYGEETEKAVRLFQVKYGLKADGIYGAMTHAMLMAVSNPDDEDDAGDNDIAPAQPQAPSQAAKKALVTGNTVRIRKGPGTQYDTMSFATRGMALDIVGQDESGWLNVNMGGALGWIGPKYTEVI